MIKNKTVIGIAVVLLLIVADLCEAAGMLDDSLNELTAQIVSGLSEREKYKIAVVEFDNTDGKNNELSTFISEELTTRLVKTKRLSVVERRLINQLLEEQNLNLIGVIDDKNAMKIGKILGVDALCTGTITDLGEILKVNARLISAETGAIFAVASTEMLKDDKVKSLTRRYKPRKQVESKSDSKQQSTRLTDNLLDNGNFTNRYEGWAKQVGDITQGSSKTEIISFPAGASGKALHLRHEGKGSIQFSQTVNVSSPDLLFAASFQASSHEGSLIGFTGSGVSQIALQYINEDGNLIGQTILLNYVKNPFADTPLIGVPRRASDTYKSHYIEFQNNKLYSNYRIDIRKEIEDNLLGVDVAAARKIAVVIWCGANHSQAGSELWITDISMKIK